MATITCHQVLSPHVDRSPLSSRQSPDFRCASNRRTGPKFDTGATTLALHPATVDHPAGSCQVGFRVADIAAFYAEQQGKGVPFTAPPADMHGQKIARFIDSEGAECSVSGQ
jgi:hypothetical protein